MISLNNNVITLAACLIFSVPAMAESMTRNQYLSQKKSIKSEYKSAQAVCDSLAGNANDICIAEAKGNSSIANAELKFNYKPSAKSRFGLSIAKADAEYAVAAEKCDDMAAKARGVCVKEARAIQIQQITDAKIEAKTMKPNTAANKKLPDTNAEMTNQEPMEDDSDSAVTEVKPIESDESDIIPIEKDIFEKRIRILA
jgi:hypothetical protein